MAMSGGLRTAIVGVGIGVCLNIAGTSVVYAPLRFFVLAIVLNILADLPKSSTR